MFWVRNKKKVIFRYAHLSGGLNMLKRFWVHSNTEPLHVPLVSTCRTILKYFMNTFKLCHIKKHKSWAYTFELNYGIKSILHMYCCGTRKSHPRTRIIRQKRGSVLSDKWARILYPSSEGFLDDTHTKSMRKAILLFGRGYI